MTNARVDVELIVGNVRDILAEIKAMGEQCGQASGPSPVSADSAERKILAHLLELGVLLMSYFFAEAGEGDMGKQTLYAGETFTRKQRISKSYQSIFGTVIYSQWRYNKVGGALWPLDQKLNLPKRQASYFVQEILTGWAAQMSFESASHWFMKLFGQSFSPRTIGELAAEAVAHDTSFTKHRQDLTEPSPPPETQTIQAVSFDGAGVPMRSKSRLAATGVKREALIGVVYEAAPQQREARTVATNLIDGLFKRQRQAAAALPDDDTPGEDAVRVDQYAYYRASLKDKEQVVEDLAANASQRRRPDQKQVVLLDGAHRLWDLATCHFKTADAKILDIVHVVGYLQMAACALVPQKQHQYAWLVAALTSVLDGGAHLQIQIYKSRLQQADLSASAAENLQTVITYFENHLQYMQYDTYLRQGYPIGTGVVESACKQLVRQRLDHAGARWHLPNAEAMLKLRAMQLSNDDEPYRKWRQNQEYIHLHTAKVA